MLAASAKFRPALAWFARQIAPSVLATLIAALVIAGYNRAFSGHLQQPRMAALHEAMDKATGTQPTPPAAEADAAAKPKPAWTTQIVEIIAPTGDVERVFDKDEGREAAKDQSKLKIADVAPAAVPAPVAPRPVAVRQEPPRQEPRPEFRQEPRQEWREPRVPEPQVVVVDPRGPVPMAPPPGGYLAVQHPVVVQGGPIAVAPMPAPLVPVAQPPVAGMPVAQEPPPVIAAKPMVTVPDRPGLRPAYEAQAPGQVQQQAEMPPQQRPGMLGTIVDTLKPSSLFRSAREFGDKIEAAGNDILPNIRQQ
jgi:hypothetical protein